MCLQYILHIVCVRLAASLVSSDQPRPLLVRKSVLTSHFDYIRFRKNCCCKSTTHLHFFHSCGCPLYKKKFNSLGGNLDHVRISQSVLEKLLANQADRACTRRWSSKNSKFHLKIAPIPSQLQLAQMNHLHKFRLHSLIAYRIKMTLSNIP